VLAGGLGLLDAWLKPLLPPDDPEFRIGGV